MEIDEINYWYLALSPGPPAFVMLQYWNVGGPGNEAKRYYYQGSNMEYYI